MIAKLSGNLESVGDGWLVIDVGGVGYMVYCSARTLRSLPSQGGVVSLAIETHVREDHIHLYGFSDTRERDWFGLLQTVQGVGARVALGILSVLSPESLTEAVELQDPTLLTQASGVGPKLGKRIIAELKDRSPLSSKLHENLGNNAQTSGFGHNQSANAISALVNLGYRRIDARTVIVAAEETLGPDVAVEELIRHGLRELGH